MLPLPVHAQPHWGWQQTWSGALEVQGGDSGADPEICPSTLQVPPLPLQFVHRPRRTRRSADEAVAVRVRAFTLTPARTRSFFLREKVLLITKCVSELLTLTPRSHGARA